MNEALKSIGFQSTNRGIGCLVQQELNMWDQSHRHTLALARPLSLDTHTCASSQHSAGQSQSPWVHGGAASVGLGTDWSGKTNQTQLLLRGRISLDVV